MYQNNLYLGKTHQDLPNVIILVNCNKKGYLKHISKSEIKKLLIIE